MESSSDVFDRYHRQVASLAVLTEAGKRARHGVYQRGLFGHGTLFTFPVVKLSDYRDRRRSSRGRGTPSRWWSWRTSRSARPGRTWSARP
ncbi:MAG: hypothetical protein HY721_10120 [Planctomycetes bacterium]|nr:hypothetical protein [Planctomycetota bacterium]